MLDSVIVVHEFEPYSCIAQSARAVKHTDNEYPRYDTKQSDGEVPVILELWGMQSTPP